MNPTVTCGDEVIELTRTYIPEPTECPVCHGKAGRIELVGGGTSSDTYCLNPECPGKSIQRIDNWINKNRILGIGGTILVAMVEKFNMVSPADLYRLTAETIAGLEVGNGIVGLSNATKIYEQIQASRSMTIENFIGSLGIRHLGRRMVQLTREKVPGELDTLADWRSGKIKTIDCGMPNIADPIMEDFLTYSSIIDDLLQYVEITSPVAMVTPSHTGRLAGRTVVFTGKIMRDDPQTGKRFVRSQLEQKVIENGGLVSDKIQTSTPDNQFVLVQADPDSASTKSEAAKKKGAMIVGEEQFWELIGEPLPALTDRK